MNLADACGDEKIPFINMSVNLLPHGGKIIDLDARITWHRNMKEHLLKHVQ